MSRKLLVGGLIVLTGFALVAVNLLFERSDAAEVDVEAIGRRDLVAIVSAPGTIQPQLSVDMSASTMGRVTRLAVDEGERVTAGQFLLQIDPENLQALVNRGEASLEAAVSAHAQAQVAVETARVNLDVARENLERQDHLWSLRLVSREIHEQAVADVELRETELRAREVDVVGAAQRILQERATLDSARYDLTQVTITSPIDGIVTRRNIEEGETVVIGTMNNPGTVLLTIADFSVLEAEIEVDETDIPGRTFRPAGGDRPSTRCPTALTPGRVTEIGNSPIQPQAGTAGGGTQEATNFLVVAVVDGDIPGVRPGFTCTAEITTATRIDSLAVPIQATTVREVELDADRPHRTTHGRRRIRCHLPSRLRLLRAGAGRQRIPQREEREGVFVVRQGRAVFVPVTTGIAGERYFEALTGLEEGDLVITGPFEVVRNLDDGNPVDPNEADSDS